MSRDNQSDESRSFTSIISLEQSQACPTLLSLRSGVQAAQGGICSIIAMDTVQEGETVILDVNGEKLSFVQVKGGGYADLSSQFWQIYWQTCKIVVAEAVTELFK